MSVASDLHKSFSGDSSNGALYAGMIGLVLSDIIPTPGDALYFYYTRKIRNDLESGAITAKQYWTKEAIAYYTFNSLWWALVFIAVAYLGKTTGSKFKILLAFLGPGIVLSVISGNIKKDRDKFRS
jgi:hypothetical protein